MHTIKLSNQAKKSAAAINKQIADISLQKDALEEQKDALAKEYSAQFEKTFVGNVFLITDSARDESIERYIKIKEIGKPYLIGNGDAYATCSLTGSVFEVRKSVYEGVTTTSIIYTDCEHYYAHTGMKPVDKSVYREVVKQYKALIK